MKARFKHWNWREIPWIAFGVAAMFAAMIELNERTDWTNYIPVTW